jgi:hypothetical protein
VSLGAQLSYRKAADLLRVLLPPTGGTTHTTTRSRLIAVGERIDEEIRQEITENRKPDRAAKQMVIGIDGAFVKGRPPTDRANLEIIIGRIEVDAEPSKVFAVVRDQDGHAKQHVQGLLRQSGRDLETKLRVVSDGEDGMRSLVGKLFNDNEQHILDWYHIARRFEAIGKGLVYLPHVEDFEHRLSRHWHHLNRAKWKVWHGNLYGFRPVIGPTGSRAISRIVVVPHRKPDPTDQLRQGIPRRPSHIDGACGVDCGPTGGLADGEEAAHALDPTRRADVAPRALCATQRRTGQIHPMVGLRIIAGARGGGMTPQVLSSPDLSAIIYCI